jgi:alpha-D-xyloside xylohydrolase
LSALTSGFWAPRSRQRSAQAFASFDASAFQSDVESELYVRWTQWGALSPIMRFHGTGLREPWAYPEPYSMPGSPLADCVAGCGHTSLKRLAQRSATGYPVMRPMVLAFPKDRVARDANFQYLLGDRVLVAPVLRPGGRVHLWVPPGRSYADLGPKNDRSTVRWRSDLGTPPGQWVGRSSPCRDARANGWQPPGS